MGFRKLRIAWSVFCGLACVLLVVLWVRSYTWWDNVDSGGGHSIDSFGGRLLIDEEIGFSQPDWTASLVSGPILGSTIEWSTFPTAGTITRGTGTAIPDWLLVLTSGVFAAAPWLRWHYSLRTLLIATALVAVVLGAIVWLR